ncbi:hypothetical protein Tco_1100520 [Tanacetum coccineum]
MTLLTEISAGSIAANADVTAVGAIKDFDDKFGEILSPPPYGIAARTDALPKLGLGSKLDFMLDGRLETIEMMEMVGCGQRWSQVDDDGWGWVKGFEGVDRFKGIGVFKG